MIKKLIGIIVALAVIAIIVIVVLRRDNFQSMVQRSEQPAAPVPRAVVPEPVVPVVADSPTVEVPDSI